MKRYIIVMLAFLILLGACEIKKPTLPNWDILLDVPLINEKYYVSDLVDSVNIVIDDNSQILTLTGNGDVATNAFGNLVFDPNSSMNNIDILSGANTTEVIPLVDSNGNLTIAYASIVGGNFKYRFTNVNATADIDMTFLNLFNSNNEPYQINNAANSGWVTVPLNGMHIGNPNASSVVAGLQVHIQATSSQAPNTPIGEFSFQALDPMQFSVFRGYMNGLSTTLEQSSSSITIDYPHDVDESITLREASLSIDIENEVGFGALFHGRIFAHNEAGDTLSVPILDNNGQNFHVEPATLTGSETTHMVIGEGIEPILQMMPDSLKIINGMFTFNSGTTIGHVRSTDIINVDYVVNAPFHFDLHEHEIVVDSVYALEISEENRNRIQNNALEADLTIELLNKLPVGATAKVYFGNNENLDVDNPDTYSFFKTASLLAATDPNPWQSIEINMTKEELDVFAQPQVYYTWSFSFQEVDNVTIYARTTDYIHVRSKLKARVVVEDL